jgi:hypothetical protein
LFALHAVHGSEGVRQRGAIDSPRGGPRRVNWARRSTWRRRRVQHESENRKERERSVGVGKRDVSARSWSTPHRGRGVTLHGLSLSDSLDARSVAKVPGPLGQHPVPFLAGRATMRA